MAHRHNLILALTFPTITLGKSKISLLIVKHMLAAIGLPEGVIRIHELKTALSVLSKA